VRWLKEEGEEVNAESRKLPKLPRKLVTVLSRLEIARLEATTGTERDKLIVRVLADCGVRVGELVKLRIHDFESRAGTTSSKSVAKGPASGSFRSTAPFTAASGGTRTTGRATPTGYSSPCGAVHQPTTRP